MAITPEPADDGHQPEPPEPMMSTAELAAYLGGTYTAETITRCWRRWKLPTHKIGRELRFRKSEVSDWLESRRAN